MGATRGHLLDNNIISILLRPKDPRYAAIKARFEAIQPTERGPIFLPVIAIAEIEAGMAKADIPDLSQGELVRRFFSDYPHHLAVDDGTVEPYALIRGQLWRDYGTPKSKGRGHIEKLPEELMDRVTGKALGIDERDLLIAATAAQYGVVLVTNDSNSGMKRIEEAALRLEANGKKISLKIQFWP